MISTVQNKLILLPLKFNMPLHFAGFGKMFTKRTIDQIILTVTGRDGSTYAVVTYHQGGYGITRDGAQIEALFWQSTDGEMDKCTRSLMRLAGMDEGRAS